MDPTIINSIWGKTTREIWAVTAASGSDRGGLIATFVNQASIVPDMPRVLIGVARQHHTWQLIQKSGAFALNLLGEEHLEWVWRFGTVSGRDQDKLAGLEVITKDTGSPVLSAALAWLDCRVEAALDTGDRTLYLAAVLAAELVHDKPPLTANRLFQLAPPDRLRILRQQFEHDGRVDGEAIRQWRNSTPA